MKGQQLSNSSGNLPSNHQWLVLWHELFNVLHGLLGMTELLGHSRLSSEQKRWVRAIEQSGRQMHQLIQSSRAPDSSFAESDPAIENGVDGAKLLERLMLSHAPAARGNGNRLILVIDPELPCRWKCNPCQIRQLLDNIIGNAIKFTHEGEIVVEALPGPDSDVHPRVLIFRVSDSGVGISRRTSERIFEAYYGTGDYESSESQSQGLGLFICRDIVQKLGGTIQYTGQNGGGSCFEISLPEVLVSGDGQPSALPVSLLETVSCHLVLAEPMLQSVKSILTRLGIRWTDCSSRSEQGGGNVLEIEIKEVSKDRQLDCRGLLLTHGGCDQAVLTRRVLELPVLEPVLGSLILEMAFEWNGQQVRNENPGSIPRPR